MPRIGGSASAFCRAASAASGSAMTVRPAAPARPRFSSLRRPIRSSSSRRRNSYSCSWKSSTDISLGSCAVRRSYAVGGRFCNRVSGRGLAVESATESGCARRCTRTRRTRTASSRPGRSRGTTGAPATTSSRSPTTGTGARPRRPPELVVLPGVELNCVLPGGPRRARARHRDRARPDGARGRAARPRGDGGLDRRRGRRRLSRASRTGPARGPAGFELPRVRHRDRGVQRGLRARGRARPVVGALGRAARGRPRRVPRS